MRATLRFLPLTFLAVLTVLVASAPLSARAAGSLDALRQALERGSAAQVQEKVYVHTDNQCYFVGDTLWYKAYVVRADDLRPTDMSRLLYVELLSPDGLLVERQRIVVSPTGYTCGQFALRDSLYSGYYELRAYTRWMLNFNVRQHRHRRDDTWWFYNRQMANDYFRVWDGLYSRVFPVYSKPETAGDYDARRMYQRPKTRLPRVKKDDLQVTFYPEGGHLLQGVENRVAFEAKDQHGEALSVKGTIETADGQVLDIKTEYMGRGTFLVTPGSRRLKARFHWHDKEWTADLPKAEEGGAAIRLDDGGQLTISSRNLPGDKAYGLSVMCRGRLVHFEELGAGGSSITRDSRDSRDSRESSIARESRESSESSELNIRLPYSSLPTGVNELTLFGSDGRIWADRLFFVNHHDHDSLLITSDISATHTYAPYEQASVEVRLAGVSGPTTFSLAIHDTSTDEPTYDDGNVMTGLLLSSDLRGFVARPAHYFEADDDLHRRHLDLLMMVQGWRKYKWQELADTTRQLRYQPETTLTIEGTVYKALGIYDVQPDEIEKWQDGLGMVGNKTNDDPETADPFMETAADENAILGNSWENSPADQTGTTDIVSIDYGDMGDANAHLGVNHGNLKHEVLVEAEISVDGVFVGGVQKTERGRFLFQVPPFYGDAFLNMKAYKESDSIKKSMGSHKDRTIADELAFPDYYVKRDLFWPVYSHDYTFYEKHQPDYDAELLIDTLSEFSMENDVHQLSNVNVKGHRRGRRAIDWKKPAFVMDAYDIYNEITDRGLSFGRYDMRLFPLQVCHLLYGNMNRSVSYNVDGRLGGHTYWRNYNPDASSTAAAGRFRANRTGTWIYNQLYLKRLQDVRVFSDFEPRCEDSLMIQDRYTADATVDLVNIPDDGVQPTFRDRHLVFHGVNMAEDFYQPDYSGRAADDQPADYRRTLYWNPNAVSDEQGRFTATFFNNGKETRIKMSAAGVTGSGQLLHSK